MLEGAHAHLECLLSYVDETGLLQPVFPGVGGEHVLSETLRGLADVKDAVEEALGA